MTESNKPPPAKGFAEVPVLIENLLAPEMFASEASSFSHSSHTITITFVSYRWDNSLNPGEQRRVVVGRLVLPVPGAKALAAGLYGYMKRVGLDPFPTPADRSQVQ